MQEEFPEVIEVSSIGKSYQGRDIKLITLDAREFIVKHQMQELSKTIVAHQRNHLHKKDFTLTQLDVQNQVQSELSKHYGDKPAILLTGQHHSREHITANVVLFSLLKLLHGGVVWHA